MRQANSVNLASLISIQAANAITPLLVFPYALSVLGPESYAAVATTEVVAILVMSIVLYSFEVDGVARIIKISGKEEHREISQIFSTILYSRLVLFFTSAIAVLIACIFLESQISILVLLWLSVPLSYAIQPAWLFQALESNLVHATITVTGRLTCLGLIYLLVSSPADAMLVPLIIGGCYVASSIFSLIYARFTFGLKLEKIAPSRILEYIKSGRKIFGGSVAVTLYRDFNVVILGLASTNPTAVATYSIAEKLIKGLQAFIRPLNQMYFPKLLKRLEESKKKSRRDNLQDLLPYIYPQLIVLSCLTLTFIMMAILSLNYFDLRSRVPGAGDIFMLLIVMLPSVFLGVANYMLGTAGLNFLGAQGYLYKSILITGILSLVSCFALSHLLDAIGAASTFVLAEAVLLASIARKYRSNI